MRPSEEDFKSLVELAKKVNAKDTKKYREVLTKVDGESDGGMPPTINKARVPSKWAELRQKLTEALETSNDDL